MKRIMLLLFLTFGSTTTHAVAPQYVPNNPAPSSNNGNEVCVTHGNVQECYTREYYEKNKSVIAECNKEYIKNHREVHRIIQYYL
jgi:hypothetical protein